MDENERRQLELQAEKAKWDFRNTVMNWVLFLSIVGVIICAVFSVPWYLRYQKRMNAANMVRVNEIVIQQTQQLVQVENQKAQIRIAEANGIAAAQHIINATLTDRYLQHEAIRAQEKMAGSPNHTQIYIPVGTNGIPLVRTVNPADAPVEKK